MAFETINSFHLRGAMKSFVCWTIGFWMGLIFILLPHRPLAAQEVIEEPLISLSATDQPLAEVLDRIAAKTGYQFNINPAWERHRVSATLTDIPLERGLKRLLRSLNHSILWESNRVVSIMVYGRAESGVDDGAISFAPAPREVPEDEEPAADELTDDEDSEDDELLLSDDDGDTATIAADQQGDDKRVETNRQKE